MPKKRTVRTDLTHNVKGYISRECPHGNVSTLMWIMIMNALLVKLLGIEMYTVPMMEPS